MVSIVRLYARRKPRRPRNSDRGAQGAAWWSGGPQEHACARGRGRRAVRGARLCAGTVRWGPPPGAARRGRPRLRSRPRGLPAWPQRSGSTGGRRPCRTGAPAGGLRRSGGVPRKKKSLIRGRRAGGAPAAPAQPSRAGPCGPLAAAPSGGRPRKASPSRGARAAWPSWSPAQLVSRAQSTSAYRDARSEPVRLCGVNGWRSKPWLGIAAGCGVALLYAMGTQVLFRAGGSSGLTAVMSVGFLFLVPLAAGVLTVALAPEADGLSPRPTPSSPPGSLAWPWGG